MIYDIFDTDFMRYATQSSFQDSRATSRSTSAVGFAMFPASLAKTQKELI